MHTVLEHPIPWQINHAQPFMSLSLTTLKLYIYASIQMHITPYFQVPIQMGTISLSLSFNFLPEHVGIHCISLSFLFLALTRSQTPLDVKIIIYILAMFSAKLTKCLVYILVCFIFLVLFVDMSLTLFHEGVLHFKRSD